MLNEKMQDALVRQINRELYSSYLYLAMEEKDHATNAFLQWFVNEQVEEEASTNEVVQRIKLIGNDGGGLFMMDRELAQRVFTMSGIEGE